jgi:hypothetical protein
MMNRGGVNLKTIIVIVIILLVGVLSVLGVGATKTYLSGAAVGTEPRSVIATSDEDGKSATVSWSSDKATQGIVEYGTTPASLLLRNPETDAATSHRIVLTSLKPNTSYYFRIRVGDEIFDNSGIPYSFKTKAGAASQPSPVASIVVPTAPVVVPTGVNGCNRTTDYDGNGVVNSVDYFKCVKDGPGSAPVTKVSPTSAPVPGECKEGVDYDGNGVINSVDRIKCLQKK